MIAEDSCRTQAIDLFDRLFPTSDDRLSIRRTDQRDGAFLDELAASSSPLLGVLPGGMIARQAALQRLGHAQVYPAAMRRIARRDDRDVGYIAVDWHPIGSRCIEIAVMPGARALGIGTALLKAWLTVADRLSLPATLSVRPDSRAVALYRRLGFVEHGVPNQPLMTMSRTR